MRYNFVKQEEVLMAGLNKVDWTMHFKLFDYSMLVDGAAENNPIVIHKLTFENILCITRLHKLFFY